MERGFYNEDIEELLKEKADQYKMYPSDKVWKGIHRSLHSNRKWYWLSLVLFLSAVGYYTFMEFITPSTAGKPISGNNTPSPASKTENNESNNSTKAVIVPFGTPKQNNNTASGQRTFVLNPENNNEAADGIIAPLEQPTAPVTVLAAVPDYDALSFNDETPVYDLNKWQARKLWQPELVITAPAEAEMGNEPAVQSYARVPAAASLTNPVSINAAMLEANSNNTEEDNKRAGWLAHNAVYELAVPKQRRLSWQLSFVPTMNYRTLKGSNHPSEVKTVPLNFNPGDDPLKLLNHKPALGFEVGSNILYAVNKTFTLKTGIQFNYIRYDIQAYSSNTAVPAIIALNTNYGGIVTGQLNSYTRYRNFNGDQPTNLTNQYFQLALPMGLEINLLGKKKLQVGIGGSVQPTYLLKKNPYLLTADYKYATEPALVRRWNVNTSAEAFISYKTGDLKWQVGPQVRYQLFSSFIKQYPIRENLFEYGIKIGVTKTIR
ncbi:hypothetical protein [Niastella populi]|uniref:Outer membrane protein beta-barrel domain-containing protein n=1 Tax=Niastella populi TaxID=550983 RepID=A0A1V9EK87_9BACT|nr:hypothetical protein [Niastella populi]OQP46567.1 hypothetical protein A4R26_07490 [Niastella populi]